MTAMLDYGVFPPELNSARMYAGPGSGSMLSAASAWDGLAADLRSQAANYGSVVAGLTSGEWQGPASTSMAAAAAPYVAWMNTTAAQAEQTAAQAKSAAAAYEAAFSATVPPPVIAANRAQLASAGRDERPRAEHPGDRGQRGPLRRDVGPRRRGDVRLCRPVLSRIPVDLVHAAGPDHQLRRVGQPVGGGQRCHRHVGAVQHSGVAGALSKLTSRWIHVIVDGNLHSDVWSSSLSALSSLPASDRHGLGNNSNAVLGVDSNFWNTDYFHRCFQPHPGRTSHHRFDVPWRRGQHLEQMAPSGMAAGAGACSRGSPVWGLSGLGGAGSGDLAGLGKAATLGPLSVPPAWSSIAHPSNSPLGSALGATPLNAPAPRFRHARHADTCPGQRSPTRALRQRPNTGSGRP